MQPPRARFLSAKFQKLRFLFRLQKAGRLRWNRRSVIRVLRDSETGFVPGNLPTRLPQLRPGLSRISDEMMGHDDDLKANDETWLLAPASRDHPREVSPVGTPI